KISAFNWGKVKAPQTAERVKMGLCCVFADFKNGITDSVNADHLVIEKEQSFVGASLKVSIPRKEELAVLLVANVFFESGSLGKTALIENQNFQAGLILDVAHIKNGALVEFVAEKLPEKSEEPVIKANAFWQLEEP